MGKRLCITLVYLIIVQLLLCELFASSSSDEYDEDTEDYDSSQFPTDDEDLIQGSGFRDLINVSKKPAEKSRSTNKYVSSTPATANSGSSSVNKSFIVSLEIGKIWNDSLENSTTLIFEKYQQELELEIVYVVGAELLAIEFAYFRNIEDPEFVQCVFKLEAGYKTKKLAEEAFEPYLIAGHIRNLRVRRNRFFVRDISNEHLQQNLHKPVFRNCSNYSSSVMESQPIGTYVFQAKADDADAPEFGGIISYSILPADKSLDLFSIDSITGLVKTKAILDRDEPARNEEIYITVRATDNGRPQLSTVCTAKITILDINDNSPIWSKIEYKWSIPENFTVGRAIFNISAIDIDDGNNGKVNYWLESHPQSPSDVGNFSIDRSSGTVRLKNQIKRGEYFLQGMAIDRGQAFKLSKINITITVVESSKTFPTFKYQPDTIFIRQNSRYPTQIVNISAKSNVPADEMIFYELLVGPTAATNKYSTFILETVGKDSAQIKLNRDLANEIVSSFTLTIMATNKDDLSEETKISILVTDFKGAQPYFIDVGKGSVLENEPVGSSVIQVKAVHPNPFSPNRNVTYYLGSHIIKFYTMSHYKTEHYGINKYFSIDRYTGDIKTLKKFDRELEAFYQVTVEAEFNSPTKSITTTLIIEIKDRNDNAPFFSKQLYNAEIYENSMHNTKVIDIKSEDKDSDSLITYDIIEGNEKNAFFIENTDTGGVIRSRSALDYKDISEYNLTIRASDSLYDDYTTLRIKVIEVNSSFPSPLEFESEIHSRQRQIEEIHRTSTDCIYYQNCLEISNGTFNGEMNCYLNGTHPDFLHLYFTRLREIMEQFKNLDWERRQILVSSLKHLKSNVCSFFQPSRSTPNQHDPRINLQSLEKDASELLLSILREIAKNCHNELTCKFCTGTDGYGNSWKICQGEVATQNCPDLHFQNEYSTATWYCPKNSTKFEGETPNYFGCRSKFQNELPIESLLNQQKPTQDSIKQRMLFLKDVVTQNQKTNGTLNYFGYEISQISKLALEAVQKTNNSNASILEVQDITENSLAVIASLLANKEQWRQLSQNDRYEVGTSVLKDLEETAIVLAKKRKNFREIVFPLNNTQENHKDGINVIMGSEVLKPHQDKTFHFSDKRVGQDSSISVKIPGNSLNPTDNDKIVEYVGSMIQWDYVDNILHVPVISQAGNGTFSEDNSKRINGKMISFQVAGFPSLHFEDENVRLVFAHNVPAIGKTKQIFQRKLHSGEIAKAVLGETACAFWDERKSKWSTEGCRRVPSESDTLSTTCACKHLTSFAVLTGFHEYAGKDYSLQMLTWVLCPISMICLLITAVIFSTLKFIRTDQTLITANLCVALLFGNLFLLLSDKNNFYISEILCTVLGAFNHYFWLCAFGWMAVGGIHLYQKVVRVFQSERDDLMKIYSLIAYGIPLLIVGATITSGFLLEKNSIYSGEMFCWLTGNYIWGFMAPVLLVLLGNLGIFVKAVLTACNVRKSKLSRTDVQVQEKQQHKANLKLIKGSVSLSLLLGLTWFVGFFTMVDFPMSHALAYIFTILNASQGIFIFIFHCCLNKTISTHFSKVVSESFSTNSWSSPATNSTSLSFRNVRNQSRGRERSSLYM